MARRRALLIAVDKYVEKSIPDLKSPVRDAKKLADALKHPRCGCFEVQTVSSKTSVEEAQIAIERFYREADPLDVTLLFFSGHGKKDDGDGLNFLLRNTKADYLRATSLTDDFLKDVMRNCASDRLITILDCCQAGAFNQPGMKGISELKSVKVDPGGYGKYILTAAGAESAAWEDEGSSLFSKYLIEALTFSGDAREKEQLTPQDLHDYIGQRLRRMRKSIPPMEASNLESELIIAENERVGTAASLLGASPALETADAPPPRNPMWERAKLGVIGVLAVAVLGLFWLNKDTKQQAEIAAQNSEVGWSGAESHPDYAGYNARTRFMSPALLDGTRTTGRPVPWVVHDFRTCAVPANCVNEERDVRVNLFPAIWSPFSGEAFPDVKLPLMCVEVINNAGMGVLEFALSNPLAQAEIKSIENANAICKREAGESYVWYRRPTTGGSRLPAGQTSGDGQLTSYLSDPEKIFRVSMNPEHAFWVNWAAPKSE